MIRYHCAGAVTAIDAPPDHGRTATLDTAPALPTTTTVTGRIVPWEYPERITPEVLEWFARGAVDTRARPPLRVGHGGPNIGRCQWLDDLGDGLYGGWELTPGPAGDLAADFLTRNPDTPLSLAFRPIRNTEFPSELGYLGTHRVRRDHVDITEVSIVTQGAYRKAHVIAVTPTAATT